VIGALWTLSRAIGPSSRATEPSSSSADWTCACIRRAPCPRMHDTRQRPSPETLRADSIGLRSGARPSQDRRQRRRPVIPARTPAARRSMMRADALVGVFAASVATVLTGPTRGAQRRPARLWRLARRRTPRSSRRRAGKRSAAHPCDVLHARPAGDRHGRSCSARRSPGDRARASPSILPKQEGQGASAVRRHPGTDGASPPDHGRSRSGLAYGRKAPDRAKPAPDPLQGPAHGGGAAGQRRHRAG